MSETNNLENYKLIYTKLVNNITRFYTTPIPCSQILDIETENNYYNLYLSCYRYITKLSSNAIISNNDIIEYLSLFTYILTKFKMMSLNNNVLPSNRSQFVRYQTELSENIEYFKILDNYIIANINDRFIRLIHLLKDVISEQILNGMKQVISIDYESDINFEYFYNSILPKLKHLPSYKEFHKFIITYKNDIIDQQVPNSG